MISGATVGLVLSGGGFRAAAQIGAIKALNESGIHAHFVSGVSAGSLVGACYAARLSCEDMLALFNKPKLFSLTHYGYKKPGMLDTDKLKIYLEEFIPSSTFEELEIPLFISATNMLSGKLETFYSGGLHKPLLGSCAFPFIFSPVEYMGNYYSDGGIINNFPVEPLLEKCQTIIGIYVNPVTEVIGQDLNSSVKVLQRAFSISTSATPYKKFDKCNIIIEPKDLSNFNLFDRRNIQKIYEIGYQETCKVLEKEGLK
ncbi:MAG: patatin-like phospholipase family protein [Saprospiraceae bacterium]